MTVLIGLSIFSSLGQNENKVKYQFAKEIFRSKKYVKNNYSKFSDEIKAFDYESDSFAGTILTSQKFQYGEKIIIVRNLNPLFIKLFEKGIFNPDVIFGKETSKMSNEQFNTLTKNEKTIFNLTRNDSLTISSFEQLEKLNPNSKTRRFKFWLWRSGFTNPTEYYIEFYNEKANNKTDLKEFLENSIMSFFYRGTILI